MKVFLAHASEQHDICKRIAAKLKSRGLKVFYSEEALDASEDFDERIRAELNSCAAMIFLLSPESVAKGCYALTELLMASERWPKPRDRVLAVMAGHVPDDSVPEYVRDNVHVLKPRGDLPTETADAMVRIRRRRAQRVRRRLGGALTVMFLLLAGVIWQTRLARAARMQAVQEKLLEHIKKQPIYRDTCVTRLNSFADYKHEFVQPDVGCDPQAVIQSLSLPALVIGQTGYGKKGFMQTLMGHLAKQGKPTVLVSYRDCIRGQARAAKVELMSCLASKVAANARVSPDDAERWLSDRSRYVLMFDAIDDSALRERVYDLVHQLWSHQMTGGTVVLSAQPENLNYVLARFALEEWMVWLRDQLPTVDIRGIKQNSIRRIASEYEEHKVPAESITTILDFPQVCPEARPQLLEWIAQPKLFRERGTYTVDPVVEAMRNLGGNSCSRWRGSVLKAMLRARIWSYCHDELCNYQADADKFIGAARQLMTTSELSEAELSRIANNFGFTGSDDLVFASLSIGVLYYRGGKLMVDHAWVPDEY